MTAQASILHNIESPQYCCKSNISCQSSITHLYIGRLPSDTRDNKAIVKKMAEWREASNGRVATDAVRGGYDVNGEPIYVGRAKQDFYLMPGKIVPSHRVIYVPHKGREHSHHHYECLVTPKNGSLRWVVCSDGELPSGAIQAGKCFFGKPYFVGRAMHQGSLVIGTVHRCWMCHDSHRKLYIPFAGSEVAIDNYEVLVLEHCSHFIHVQSNSTVSTRTSHNGSDRPRLRSSNFQVSLGGFKINF